MTSDNTMKTLEWEAEKRRKQAADKARTPLPPHIKAIESTRVTYTVNPKILPFSLVDPQKLIELLNQKLRLRYKPLKIESRDLQRLGLDPSKMTDDHILSYALNSDDPELEFENGRYPTGPNSFVPIATLRFNKDQISAKVSGVTDIAEVVIADGFNAFWEATGAIMNWDSKENQENVQLVSFETTTTLDVKSDVRNLLNEGLCSFLAENVSAGEQLGARMMSHSRFDDFKPSNHSTSIWTFNQLSLYVHTFDTITGHQETSRINLRTKAVDERGRGIIEVFTDLPFDDHVKLMNSLVALLQSKGLSTKP